MIGLYHAYLFVRQEPPHQIIEILPEIIIMLLVAEPTGGNVGYFMQYHLFFVFDFMTYGEDFPIFPAERLVGKFHLPFVMAEPDHCIFEEVRENLILFGHQRILSSLAF